MAQLHAIDYLGAMPVNKGQQYTSASIITAYPTATVLKIKTDGVSVSINGGVQFLTSFDDESYLSTGKTYIFDKDCIVAIGIYKVI